MKTRKILGLVFLFVTFFSAFQIPTASAQYPRYRRVFYYHTYYGQVPYGYGYYSYRNWPANYWANPVYNGFSFYPYYNYQPRYASFGALAYSVEKDVGGYAWGYASRNDAASAATQYCQENDCAPVAWVQGGCVAMATSAVQQNIAWGYGASQLLAEKAALNSCQTSGATDCLYRSYVCSF